MTSAASSGLTTAPDDEVHAGLTPRSRQRLLMLEQIKRVAREHLARDGANLSLRAVAREVGLVSSAVYRYYASRDELLTALIIDAYNAIGDVAESAERDAHDADPVIRVLAAAHAVRGWALAHPAEYALVFGSPVPGYVAPQRTVEPATRLGFVLGAVLHDAHRAGLLRLTPDLPLPEPVRSDMAELLRLPQFDGLAPAALARAIGLWGQLVGLISFELFGHLVGSVTANGAYFDYQLRVGLAQFGLESDVSVL